MKLLDRGRVPEHVKVAVAGAGPAGLGVARALRVLAIPDVWLLERGPIEQSFLRWPSGTRLLTPSFPGNVFGLTDLNAISYDSSPGWSLKREHPDGGYYARYLEQAALAFGLNVEGGIEVLGLEPEGETFRLHTDQGEIGANFVIWACGQFGTPTDAGIIGAEHARHYAGVTRWQDVPGDETFVIGGNESGIDATLGLACAGKRVTVLARAAASWLDGDKDPSRVLSLFTRQRLDVAMKGGAIMLVDGADTAVLETYRANNMYLDDLACCDADKCLC
ncbi:NAD(P)-binding domain-containing protein [Paracoccus alkanivorans]|uniref:NAD(P)-binding domain-containing protein n=1 Tax=Paracoccus alkanivorans TaxID=2116655 RepID=UPI00140E3D96|nr:NAD(P)-binding domain-containing protein [Paracoccus alkanivorans]